MDDLDISVVRKLLKKEIGHGASLLANPTYPDICDYIFDQADHLEERVLAANPKPIDALAAYQAFTDAMGLLYGMVIQTSSEHLSLITREELESCQHAFMSNFPAHGRVYGEFISEPQTRTPHFKEALTGLIGHSGKIFDQHVETPSYNHSKGLTIEVIRTTICSFQYAVFYAPKAKDRFSEYLNRFYD